MSKGVAAIACVAGAILCGVLVHGEVRENGAPDEAPVIEFEWIPVKADPDGIPAELIEPRYPDPGEHAIHSVLRQRCHLRARNARVADIMPVLEAKLGIPIRLDLEDLDDEQVSLIKIQRITFSLNGLSAKRAIRRALERLSLTMIAEDGEIVVVPQVRACERAFLLLYPVGDLVAARLWNGIELEQLDLSELLESTVSPDSWSNVGGAGSIRYEPVGMSLLIEQTEGIHDDVELILNLLRAQRRRLPELLKAAKGPTLEEVRAAEASDQLARRELAKIEESLRELEGRPVGGGMGGGFFDVVERVVDGQVPAPAEGGVEAEAMPAQCGVFGLGAGWGGAVPRHAEQARKLAVRAMRLALRSEGIIPPEKKAEAEEQAP